MVDNSKGSDVLNAYGKELRKIGRAQLGIESVGRGGRLAEDHPLLIERLNVQVSRDGTASGMAFLQPPTHLETTVLIAYPHRRDLRAGRIDALYVDGTGDVRIEWKPGTATHGPAEQEQRTNAPP
jgi:hypothetical protein